MKSKLMIKRKVQNRVIYGGNVNPKSEPTSGEKKPMEKEILLAKKWTKMTTQRLPVR